MEKHHEKQGQGKNRTCLVIQSLVKRGPRGKDKLYRLRPKGRKEGCKGRKKNRGENMGMRCSRGGRDNRGRNTNARATRLFSRRVKAPPCSTLKRVYSGDPPVYETGPMGTVACCPCYGWATTVRGVQETGELPASRSDCRGGQCRGKIVSRARRVVRTSLGVFTSGEVL